MIPNDYIESLKKQNKLKDAVDPAFKSPIKINGKLLREELVVIAGPCSVETREQTVEYAKKLADAGADCIRAGAYKPCTYPIKEAQKFGWKEGLREKGLELLAEAGRVSKLPVITEILDVRDMETVLPYTDVIQIGMRNFQNYGLLDAVGQQEKPVLLKRGSWGMIDEILGACERIMVGGNKSVAICLRGVIGGPSYRHVFPAIRWMPDMMMIPALKELTNIPVIYDPSHSTGYANFVLPIARAAVAAGCDGIAFESHPRPTESISDASQAVDLATATRIIAECRGVRAATTELARA